MRSRRRFLGAGTTLAAALAMAGCAATADEDPAPSAPPSKAPVEMTCESILRESFVDELAELGWTAQQTAFRIGEHEITDGIQCVWGDAEHGTDVAQMYGWAPVDADEAAELQQYLEDNGWLREEDGEVVYVTEDPDVVGYLDEGEYGMTYQFVPGWVALADTKQALDLVTWRG